MIDLFVLGLCMDNCCLFSGRSIAGFLIEGSKLQLQAAVALPRRPWNVIDRQGCQRKKLQHCSLRH